MLIPPVVLDELKADSEFPGSDTVRQALQANWLRIIELKDARVAQTLALELDQGEAAAIALALELSVEHILMDERDGRAKAKALGLQPIGLIGRLASRYTRWPT